MDFLAECIGSERYNLKLVNDPDEFLTHLKQSKVDLAIVDLMLPGASGTELIHSVRIQDPDIPVIIVSGAAGVRTRYLSDKYVKKPVNEEALLSLIDSALQN